MVHDDDTSPRIWWPIDCADRPVAPAAEKDRPPVHIRELIATLGERFGYGPHRIELVVQRHHGISVPAEVVRYELAVANGRI